ncbi:hypothetical protein tb265_00740 [Gemmatimonadetes bacterium T265]|nr:hypothetical protein tb265_00740 [Gemmatimonadetes bacterium T265]
MTRAAVRTLVRAVLATLLTLGAVGPAAARAQSPAPYGTPGAAPGDSLTVSLMTIGAGDEVWERFGHNALVVRDGRTGEEVAYNWGMFDFNQPNFVGRFLTGDTRYWMQGFPARDLAEHYARVENRSVYVQELALTPAERAAVRDFVEWNAREENRYYRYDYYRDNCSTRVRDVLDRALGGQLRAQLAGVPTGTTYRSHTRRLTDGDAATYTGIQLALGRPADAPLDAWQESFLPVRMMAHLRTVRVRGADGRLVPLVAAERTAYAAVRPPEPAGPPSHAFAYGLAGAVLALVFALVAWLAAAAGGVGRLAFGFFGGVWTLVLGFFGTALLLAGTVTKHAPYMGRNWNLLAANTLAFVVLVLVVAAMGTPRVEARRRRLRRAAGAAWALATLTVVGAVFVLLPGVGQRSGELFALLVPANVALAAALAWAVRRASA